VLLFLLWINQNREMKLPFFQLIILLIFISACKSEPSNSPTPKTIKKSLFDYSKFNLQPGDILFQDSDCGPFCDAIEKVTFGIEGSKFSHVGLVLNNGKGQMEVIEAIGAGVVMTPLDTFFNRSFDADGNSKVVVGKLKKEYEILIPDAIDYAKTKLGKPYDEEFNILNEKYYCSELLYESFMYANDNQPIFNLQKMTYKDPDTNEFFPIWVDYFKDLGIEIPEDEPGLNPGGMSRSRFIEIVHYYGNPSGRKLVN